MTICSSRIENNMPNLKFFLKGFFFDFAKLRRESQSYWSLFNGCHCCHCKASMTNHFRNTVHTYTFFEPSYRHWNVHYFNFYVFRRERHYVKDWIKTETKRWLTKLFILLFMHILNLVWQCLSVLKPLQTVFSKCKT